MKRGSLIVCCLVVGGLAGTFLAGPLLKGQVPAAPALPKELTSYRDVVKKVLPAVVSIESRTKAVPAGQGRRRPPMDERVPEEFRRFFDFGGDEEAPNPHEGFGSGFLIDAKGVILTNFHVVENAEPGHRGAERWPQIHFQGHQSRSQNRPGHRPHRGAGRCRSWNSATATRMEIGDRVLAIGAPFGLTGTVTHGIISAKGRSLHIEYV